MSCPVLRSVGKWIGIDITHLAISLNRLAMVAPWSFALCALEIAKALKVHPELRVRMGIHSGPVNEVADLNEQVNMAGAGVNIAQRVMDGVRTGASLRFCTSVDKSEFRRICYAELLCFFESLT